MNNKQYIKVTAETHFKKVNDYYGVSTFLNGVCLWSWGKLTIVLSDNTKKIFFFSIQNAFVDAAAKFTIWSKENKFFMSRFVLKTHFLIFRSIFKLETRLLEDQYLIYDILRRTFVAQYTSYQYLIKYYPEFNSCDVYNFEILSEDVLTLKEGCRNSITEDRSQCMLSL